MRYHLIAIGQLKRGFYAEGCAFYAKRLRHYSTLELSELREVKATTPDAVREQESALLLKAASGYLVCLDETGARFSSRKLAAHLAELELRGVSQLSLIIGGAEGLSAQLKAEARECWALSEFTLPHELARLVLLEQLYRAETIRAGHPYHRG